MSGLIPMSDQWTKSSFHKDSYGRWAGNPKGTPCDPSRCADQVFPAERGSMHHQCRRSRGYGPEKAYCKQHDPEAEAEKAAKRKKAWEDKYNKEKRREFEWRGGPTLRDALQIIANGHNDARTVAREALAEHRARNPELYD